jgi:hypothetical protein
MAALKNLHVSVAGTVGTVKVLHAKLAVDLATLPILNPDFKSQVRAGCLQLNELHHVRPPLPKLSAKRTLCL